MTAPLDSRSHVVLYPVEGTAGLSIHPEHRSPLIGTNDSRVFIPPGVVTLQFVWTSPERGITNLRWMPYAQSRSLLGGGSWQPLPNVPAAAAGKPGLAFSSVSTRWGAAILASLPSAPTVKELRDGHTLGIFMAVAP